MQKIKTAMVLALAGFCFGCAANSQIDPNLLAQAQAVCAQDAAGQPAVLADVQAIEAVATVAGVTVPAQVTQAVVVDQTVVHPLIVQVCAGLPKPTTP